MRRYVDFREKIIFDLHIQVMKPVDESDSGQKPLAATLLQEFQNLKDKFKNEDDSNEKGVLIICCLA